MGKMVTVLHRQNSRERDVVCILGRWGERATQGGVLRRPEEHILLQPSGETRLTAFSSRERWVGTRSTVKEALPRLTCPGEALTPGCGEPLTVNAAGNPNQEGLD